MQKLYARVIGNFFVTFGTVASTITFLTGGRLDVVAIQAGFMVAFIHAVIAAGIELQKFGTGIEVVPEKTKKEKIRAIIKNSTLF